MRTPQAMLDRRNILASSLAACAVALSARTQAGAMPMRPLPRTWKNAWSEVAGGFSHDLASEGIIGGSAAFSHAGEVIGFEPYGYQDLASKRPMDLDSIYHWASITKTFTAIALMQLRDRGLVALGEPVVKYCPEVAQIHDPFGRVEQITLENLLSHSSGLRAATFPWGGDEAWEPHEPARWAQIADMMPYTSIEFQPGSKYSYSNLGFSLIGRVIEAVTGDVYQQYVIKNILMPLSMHRTYFDQTPYFLLPYRSHNYYIDAGKVTDNGPEVLTGATVANGGLNAPMGDFFKYTNFLLGLGDPAHNDIVLSRRTLNEMWTPRFPAETLAGEQVYIGLGFFIIDHKLPDGRSTKIYGHGGFQLAFHTDLQVNPDSGCALLVGANTVVKHQNAPWASDFVLSAYKNLLPMFSQ